MLSPHLLTHILRQDAVSLDLVSIVTRLNPNVACRHPGGAFGGSNYWCQAQLECTLLGALLKAG